MSKFMGMVVGGIEIGVGLFLQFATFGISTPLSTYLYVAGAGMILGNLGTLIAGSGQNQQGGLASASRNPVAAWNIVYGRARVGGTIVYLHEWGDTNKYLDMVIVLAAHACQSVDALLFDGQRVQLDGGTSRGTSFSPVQQTVSITSVARSKGVVTVQLPNDIPYLDDGDSLIIEGITSDYTLNGKFPVHVLGRSSGGVTFTYICGGSDDSLGSEGQVKTTWPDYRDRVYMETLLGDHTDTFPGMLYGTPGAGEPSPNPWTADHKLLGKCAVFLRLAYDEKVFSSGIPQISFKLRGKKDILDPRTSPATHGYTENAALCIADYLAHPTWGFRAVYGTEIPLDKLIAAANTCDESVTLSGAGILSTTYAVTTAGLAVHGYISGNLFCYWPTWPPGPSNLNPTAISYGQAVAAGYLTASTSTVSATEPRYTCNGQFTLATKRGEVLQNLLTSCAGRLSYVGGQFAIQPAAYAGRSVAFDATVIGAMSGAFRWKPKLASRELFNACKGTYISPVNNWQASDIPYYAQDSTHGYTGAYPMSDANMLADGGDRCWLDIQLPFTISASAAQRIAKIELMRRRQQGTGTFLLNMTGYQLTALDVISMTLPYFGWTDKLLEVLAHRFKMDKQSNDGVDVTVLGTEIDVQETDPSVYA